jgi:hypothetical protein
MPSGLRAGLVIRASIHAAPRVICLPNPDQFSPAASSPRAKPIPCGFPRLFPSYSPQITLIPTLSGLRITWHTAPIHKTRRPPSKFPALSRSARLFSCSAPVCSTAFLHRRSTLEKFSKRNSCRKMLHTQQPSFLSVTTQNKMEPRFRAGKWADASENQDLARGRSNSDN